MNESVDGNIVRAHINTIIQDKSFGNASESKVEYYAKHLSEFRQKYPLTLVYACSTSNDINDCIKALSKISAFDNHEITAQSDEAILQMVDEVLISEKATLETIVDIERKHTHVVRSVPLIFFKVCCERKEFNREQLVMMLNYKNQVQSGSLSLHDASVNVGSKLVDKYVKPVIPKKRKKDGSVGSM